MIQPACSRSRKVWGLIINVVAPGAGLIALGKGSQGMPLALLFALSSQLALFGLLIMPAIIPGGLASASALAAGAVWCTAQRLGLARARAICGSKADRRLISLSECAAEAMEQGSFAEAENLLAMALDINDENLSVQRQWAQFLTLTGQFRKARRAWECVIQLDISREYRAEAVAAVDRIPV